MRISAVQFLILKDADKNIAKAKDFIKKESGRSDLIVFPELFLNCKHPDHASYLLDMFCRLSREYKIDIVPGSMLTTRNGKTYNTSYYISSGRVIAKYDKSNPWKSELISQGRGPKAFRTRFGRTSLIICWDLASPEVAAKLSKLNLDLVLCPSMWWQGRESGVKNNFTWKMIDSLCLTRAYESRAAVVFVNTAGRLRMRHFADWTAGRSQAVAPFKNLICEMEGSNEGVIHYDFDPATLVLARKYFG